MSLKRSDNIKFNSGSNIISDSIPPVSEETARLKLFPSVFRKVSVVSRRRKVT